MKDWLSQLKENLLVYYETQKKNRYKDIKRKIKKIIIFGFLSGIFLSFIGFCFFVYFYINWQYEKEETLKQAEIYYNQILKETDLIHSYKDIGGSEYVLKNVEEPIRIYDYRGELLGEFSNEKRSFVAMEEISPYFFYALFSTEDMQFYQHKGINYQSILRALVRNILAMRLVEGGSTLTQQLSKILFTEREKSISRKIYEFFCAKELEKMYTKEDILLMYANLIFFGHGVYGVEYASLFFFKKNAKNLDLAEASFLVGLISNPSRYSPFLNLEKSKLKHKAVLERMSKVGYISSETAEKIFHDFWKKNQFNKKDLVKFKQVIRSQDSPYTVEEVRRFIVAQFGEEFFVKYKGARVYTTIDKRLDTYAAQILKNQIKYLRTIAHYKAANKKMQGAVVFTVPHTGEIRVFIGGDEFSADNQFNRANQAYRQIGSTVKPFLYLSGIEKKAITAYTVFEDKEFEMEIEKASEKYRFWKVKNFEEKYVGYATVTEALYRSSNVIAAKVGSLIGVDGIQAILGGVLRLNEEDKKKRFPDEQYSLALGATEMTPLEVNAAYCMLANKGISVEPYLISKIIDNKGRTLYEAPIRDRKTIASREAVFITVNMLRAVLRPGGTAGHLRSTYDLTMDAGGKTGTSQENRDVWFNGINPNLVGTVWIGHDENHSLGKKFTGGANSSPIWALIMKKASTLYELGSFEYEESLQLIKQPVCLLSGKVPKEHCLFIEENAYFIEGTEPGEYCDLTEEEEKQRALLKGWQWKPKEENKNE